MSTEGWRSQLTQAGRNEEVRQIAEVLASLEPGASRGSKLRLAMQFEDTMFKAADSLEDYRKKINKRLAKLQKVYKPDKPPEETARANKIEALRQKHGESIRYCLKHATKAIEEMRKRHGEEKASQLKQYLDNARQWAHDLGLLENTTPNLQMKDDHLERLTSSIERRLENVRSHVVKLADPDQFFAETLEKAEEECRGRASKILARNVQKRYGQMHKTVMRPEEIFQQSLKGAIKPVPLPTRSQRNDENAALIWLEKMRASSTAALAFLGADDKSRMPKGALTKLHDISTEGNKFVIEVVKNRRKNQKTPAVSLQEAWMKHLQLPGETEESMDLGGDGPPRKKARTTTKRLVTRSKILFTPGRKTPPNLLAAFRMKEATLYRPPPHGEGSHLVLHFGTAFVMTIYFIPLVVRLAAYDPTDADKKVESECAPWVSFSHGLTEQDELNVWGAKGNYATLGHIVEERLRDASAHATRVLRRIFANHAKENTPDFETEILEGTALIEFLQLARTTYLPDWEDKI